jgi:chorismate mutase
MPPVSKIAKLPAHVRKWLHTAIVERAYGDTAGITADLNAMLKDAGVPETVGTTTVNKEAQRMRQAQEALRTSVEAARMLQQDLGSGDALGGAAMDMVQSEVFQISMRLQEATGMKDDERLALIKDLSLAASRVSRARVNQDRWATEVRSRAEAAADRVTKLAQKGGLQPATVQEIRRSILGIATAEAVAHASNKAKV